MGGSGERIWRETDVSAELGKNLKLSILLKKLFKKAKRVFEIPEFRQYPIAGGIYKILFSF